MSRAKGGTPLENFYKDHDLDFANKTLQDPTLLQLAREALAKPAGEPLTATEQFFADWVQNAAVRASEQVIGQIRGKYLRHGYDESEDASGYALVKMLAALRTYDPAKGSFEDYVARGCWRAAREGTTRANRPTTGNPRKKSDHRGVDFSTSEVDAAMRSSAPTEDEMLCSIDIGKALDKLLTPRQREVVSHRFGLYRDQPATTAYHVGRRLNLSEKVVNDHLRKALEVLRAAAEDGRFVAGADWAGENLLNRDRAARRAAA